jgi:hypothetical protein
MQVENIYRAMQSSISSPSLSSHLSSLPAHPAQQLPPVQAAPAYSASPAVTYADSCFRTASYSGTAYKTHSGLRSRHSDSVAGLRGEGGKSLDAVDVVGVVDADAVRSYHVKRQMPNSTG